VPLGVDPLILARRGCTTLVDTIGEKLSLPYSPTAFQG
jgi:hypothetical protein